MGTVKHVTFPTLWFASSIVLANLKADGGNYREIRDPTSHIPDSVGESENRRCQSYVNYHAILPPTPHFRDRGDRSANGPRLSRGKGAILVPKVPYFTAYSLAGSHRLRAPAPYKRESSIGLPDPGCPRRDRKVHGKTRHFSHFVLCILDSVGKPKSC